MLSRNRNMYLIASINLNLLNCLYNNLLFIFQAAATDWSDAAIRGQLPGRNYAGGAGSSGTQDRGKSQGKDASKDA